MSDRLNLDSAAGGFLRALVNGVAGGERHRFGNMGAKPAHLRAMPETFLGATDFTSAHAVASIGGRRLHLEAYPSQARLRITMLAPGTGSEAALGSVIRLDTDDPGLRVCAPLEVEWSARHMREIVAEAVRIWESLKRR